MKPNTSAGAAAAFNELQQLAQIPNLILITKG